jgi:hypothetical protein
MKNAQVRKNRLGIYFTFKTLRSSDIAGMELHP